MGQLPALQETPDRAKRRNGLDLCVYQFPLDSRGRELEEPSTYAKYDLPNWSDNLSYVKETFLFFILSAISYILCRLERFLPAILQLIQRTEQ